MRLVDVVGAVDTCEDEEDEEEVEDIGRHTNRVKNQRTTIKKKCMCSQSNHKAITKQSQSKCRRL